jgi:hypothetical protein
MNLLTETTEAITASGHTPADIVFIGSRDSGHRCTWDEYTRLADVQYDDGFGAQKVASDLEIVFSDGSGMWRHEYDGSESWAYHQPFVQPAVSKSIVRLTVDGTDRVGWAALGELQDER